MTASLLSRATALAISATTLTGFARAATPKHLQANAPRTVTVLDSDTPPIIRAGLLQSTLILLPAEEKVATVFGGDTVSWVFDGGHVASRFISIKPKTANSTTDVHIVSDHGNEYTLQLREISGDGDAHYDSKVFITPGDQTAKDLGLQQVWRDDKFTYLRGQFQETPALYELKDGKGSLVNFDFSGGLYTVPKTLDNGYLTIGKQRVDFKRAGEGS